MNIIILTFKNDRKWNQSINKEYRIKKKVQIMPKVNKWKIIYK